MDQMLTLTEHQELMEDITNTENVFSDDMIDRADSYDIVEEEDYTYSIVLFDEIGNEITRAKFSDFDIAYVIATEIFDLDDFDEFDYPATDDEAQADAIATDYAHDV